MKFFIQYMLLNVSTILCVLFSSVLNAQDTMDDYYSHDLHDAVHQAKQAPHHYDYSTTYRYKRTTAQSIELNRLDLEEMDSTSLVGLTESPTETSIIDDLSLPTDNPSHMDSDLMYRSNQDDATRPQVELPTRLIQHNVGASVSPNGELSTQGVYSNSVLTSTPRP